MPPESVPPGQQDRVTDSAARVARLLRRIADRIDHSGAPKRTHLSFTFEHGVGMVVNSKRRGCPLWYYGDGDYSRAHDEGSA